MIPFLPTRTELAIRYNLNSDGLAVLSAVIFYCRVSPYIWYRNARQMVRDLPYLRDHTKVDRYLNKLIEAGAIKANGKILSVQNAPELVQNAPELVQNAPDIINKNINNKSSCLAGDAATPQPQQDIFIIPSFEELLSYGRERGYTYAPMQAFYQYYSANGWTLKRGARMKCWQAALGFWMGREAKMAAARAATMVQAGYRPENRAYEHKVAMSERAKEKRAMEAIYTDEDRKADAEMYERLGVKPTRSDTETAKVKPAAPPKQTSEPPPELSDDERMARLGIPLEQRELIRKSREAQKEREKKNRRAPRSP